MNIWLRVAVVACIPTLATAQSLRCDDKIISEGTSRAEVVALCGDPIQVDQKTVYYRPIGSQGSQINRLASAVVEVQVEVWIYNFGPNRLMQRIRFEDGLVVRIESLRYGF